MFCSYFIILSSSFINSPFVSCREVFWIYSPLWPCLLTSWKILMILYKRKRLKLIHKSLLPLPYTFLSVLRFLCQTPVTLPCVYWTDWVSVGLCHLGRYFPAPDTHTHTHTHTHMQTYTHPSSLTFTCFQISSLVKNNENKMCAK